MSRCWGSEKEDVIHAYTHKYAYFTFIHCKEGEEKKNDHSGRVPWLKKVFYLFFLLLFCLANRQTTYKSVRKKNFGIEQKPLRQRRIVTLTLAFFSSKRLRDNICRSLIKLLYFIGNSYILKDDNWLL